MSLDLFMDYARKKFDEQDQRIEELEKQVRALEARLKGSLLYPEEWKPGLAELMKGSGAPAG